MSGFAAPKLVCTPCRLLGLISIVAPAAMPVAPDIDFTAIAIAPPDVLAPVTTRAAWDIPLNFWP
jgi:hypothetical protein